MELHPLTVHSLEPAEDHVDVLLRRARNVASLPRHRVGETSQRVVAPLGRREPLKIKLRVSAASHQLLESRVEE